MRLLFASAFPYWPESTSGRETSAHALTLRLQARGIAVAVFAGTPENVRAESPRPFIARDETLGYPVYRVREPLLAYGDVLREVRPDIALLPFHRPNMPLVALGIAAGVKAVLHVTTVDPSSAAMNLLQRPEVMLTTCSTFAARRLAVLQGITPPVSLPLIEPELFRVDRAGDAVIMVNPTLMKGIEIFFRLAEARPQLRFIAVESWDVDDAWRLILSNRARACGNVELWPTTTDMRTAYRAARLVLMPSVHEETYGRVVAEAQLSGIPALTSDRGELPAVVGGGGLTVPVDAGIEPWLTALDRVLDPAAYGVFSAAARREAERPERRPEAIVEDFVSLLDAFLIGANTTS
jgi:glycosyltransferase involved in cell wall biosynthesis